MRGIRTREQILTRQVVHLEYMPANALYVSPLILVHWSRPICCRPAETQTKALFFTSAEAERAASAKRSRRSR